MLQSLAAVTRAAPEPLYLLRLQAVRVADDDGMRAALISPAQVRQWVDKANGLYAAAGIRILFEPNLSGPNWSTLNRTAVNNLSSSNASSWNEGLVAAANYPGKQVVFFRWGDGAAPTGNGFAFPFTANGHIIPGVPKAMAMCSFLYTSVATHNDANGLAVYEQNIWLFGHEMGHWLGLDHPFPGASDSATGSPALAASYIAAHGSVASALDGDGLSDTPPDAGTAFYLNQGWDPCSGHDSYTISGITFTPDRHNPMSYFACDPQAFTAMQIERMRASYEDFRSASGTLNSTANTIESLDGTLSLAVPSSALTAATLVSVAGAQVESAFGLGDTLTDLVQIANLGPSNLSFRTPATLSITWPDADDDGIVDNSKIRAADMFLWINGAHVPGTTSCANQPCTAAACCDMATHAWRVQVSTPGEYAVGQTCGTIHSPQLTLTKLNTPAGDDGLTFRGTFSLPNDSLAALDPVAYGVDLVLDDNLATSALFLTVPAGIFDAATKAGWKVNASHTTWTYTNKNANPPGGVVNLILQNKSKKTPGLVQVQATGKKGSYAVSATLRVKIILGGSRDCFAASFAGTAPSCSFNKSGSTLKCK